MSNDVPSVSVRAETTIETYVGGRGAQHHRARGPVARRPDGTPRRWLSGGGRTLPPGGLVARARLTGAGEGSARACAKEYGDGTALGSAFLLPCANTLTEEREGTSMSQPEHHSVAPADIFEIRSQTQRRTALVELFGELDFATVPQVTDAFNDLPLDADGLRHVVLDLRGLTFMDATGLRELVRQSNDAAQNRHNLAIVRGRASISRLMTLADLDRLLILVESPEDLVPPPSTAPGTLRPRKPDRVSRMASSPRDH
jgi:anti-sigma B factor antagonist